MTIRPGNVSRLWDFTEMDIVRCYRCGREMRRIPRLGIFFCDTDGYILSFTDAVRNGLVESETDATIQSH